MTTMIERELMRRRQDVVRLKRERDELREALTDIWDVCRRGDFADTYTAADLAADYERIRQIVGNALANLNKTDKDRRDKSLADMAALNKTDGE